jgi:putative peptide zinc metalloprotease protein
VLGALGGGQWAIDSLDEEGLRTLEPVFWVDVMLEQEAAPRIGDRAYVRFEHENRALASQVGRALHGLFLRRLDL